MKGFLERGFERNVHRQDHSAFIEAYLEANRKHLSRLREELQKKNVTVPGTARVLRLPQDIVEDCDS